MSEGPVLRTERLTLHPFVENDIDELHRVFQDAEVRRYLLDARLVSREWVAEELTRSRNLFEVHGYGLWSLRRTNRSAVIGFAGYRFFHEPPELQLVSGLLPPHWRRGLATEACRGVIGYGFGELGFTEIRAETDAANGNSIRLIERLGMRFQKRMKRSRLATVYYVLKREDRGDGPSAA